MARSYVGGGNRRNVAEIQRPIELVVRVHRTRHVPLASIGGGARVDFRRPGRPTASGWSESFAGKWLNDSAHAHQPLIAAGSDRLLHSRNRSLACGSSTVQARTTALACCDKRTAPRCGRRPARRGASATCPKRKVEINDVGRDRRATGRTDEVVYGFRFSVTKVFQCTPRRSGSAVVSHRWAFLAAAGEVAGSSSQLTPRPKLPRSSRAAACAAFSARMKLISSRCTFCLNRM